jgi:predicted transcriptional regulator
MNNSERFLNAFISIETYMSQRLKGQGRLSFQQKVQILSKLDSSFARYKIDLEEYAQLRNAIVHDRIQNEVIAEPHLKTVEHIEHILEILTQPILVQQHFLGKVYYGKRSDSLEKTIGLMSKHHFSKLPIYDDKLHFVGLLSADVIVEYLYHHMKEMMGCLPEVKVSEVLKTDTKSRSVEFIPTHYRLLSVIELYEKSLQSGRRLHAIIITRDGASNQEPLGIISVTDLPKIYQLLKLYQG